MTKGLEVYGSASIGVRGSAESRGHDSIEALGVGEKVCTRKYLWRGEGKAGLLPFSASNNCTEQLYVPE